VFAQLMHHEATGQWELFVPLSDKPAGEWPAYAFAPGRQLPTIRERERGLRRLGYKRTTEQAAWEWLEASGPRPIATTPVAPR
jgi:hypothetical protein